MKEFRGERTIDGIRVTVDGDLLDQQLHVKQFTDLGFEWTYEGDSPRQLALAILVCHLGDGEKALALCEPFMKSVIAQLDNEWHLTSEEIDKALSNIG